MSGVVTSIPICLHVVDADKCTFIVKEDGNVFWVGVHAVCSYHCDCAPPPHSAP